jgi:hypothetical protein
MKADETENKKPDAPATELNDSDLEKASGGLWGITLIDMCKGKFDENLCLHALVEPCPQLVICSRKTTYVKNSKEDLYVYTCNKGCFKDLKLWKSVTD